MGRLERHYGSNASLTPAEVSDITRFLVANAGQQPSTTAPTDLPRVTQTAWFQRKHRKISDVTWSHPQIKNPNNCAACHTQAQQGSFSEHEISVPGQKGQRW